ncbi:MAG TPA: hypothetical protein DEE98_01605 [Elusimicrobia bacterium]|nr:MAG: hypothetical protein A2278_06110 [Elusimicrobia bacterium RIFOXYA12_FULL_49_49]OGS16634.1 MAG: hypothetical protein A2251_04625 [Elusimicrobia bacterium RIFOXYA2_FULL_47_53]OGS25483.1 MAG: hypothetical protein A2339_00200 [Elusimicrobia bacterium RIFOXYB12_FULL_50_12]OGS31612.1 MAG: hypothetical protein A2323_03345 [Elusimicrobia bacterium RIFOXYB2_FULL_46_23]HBU69059.1 hypothetical protein [Elusimicrobiota bacterium]
MKTGDKLKTAALSAAGLVVLYFLFNWVMSAAIHSRKQVMVPDLLGKSLNESISLLSSANLGLKKEGEEYDQSLPAGTVIRQNPLAGMPVLEGKIVRVVLSQGGEMTFVPDLFDQPVRSAEIAIRSSGLSLGEESSRFSVVAAKGNVVSQDPAAGTIAEKDSIVNLVISAGPPAKDIILVPKFVGKDIIQAGKWAEKNSVEAAVTEDPLSALAPGIVISQSPEADSDISVSRKLTLVVSGHGGSAPVVGNKFHYEVPQGGDNRQVKFTLIDETGEREIFNGIRPPGSKLEVPYKPTGRSKVRIYINGILVEEKEVQ